MKAQVLAGPRTIGNSFGSYGHVVPEGKWAVIKRGPYSNGGFGPLQVGPSVLYDNKQAAQAAADKLNNEGKETT